MPSFIHVKEIDSCFVLTWGYISFLRQKKLTNALVSVYFQGGRKYQIKGCAGQGGFAQVFKAYIDSNPDEVVALKVIS